MVKTQYGDSNIFNISDPQSYRCQVHYYHNRLSRLYITVFKPPQTTPLFALLFSDVAYFECPVNWQGADFRIASGDDCIALMLNAGLIGQAILQFPNAYASITDYARLYQVTTNGKPIQIIASSANMLHHLPDDLR